MSTLATTDAPAVHEFLTGGGGMARLIRSGDWRQTPLGPIEGWPQSLRTTVSLCLASNFPINIVWGPGHAQIYNDAYRMLCGGSHPRALGESYEVTWASAWPILGAPFERALAGQTSFLENQRMFLTRNGCLEEAFFTFSLSPIRDESGGIGGLFHPVTETTATMLAERRTRALRDLTARLGAATDAAGLAECAGHTQAAFALDLPFLLFYALDADSGVYRLAGSHGLAAGGPASPATLDPDARAPWPVADALAALAPTEAGGLAALLAGAPCGPYGEPPERALVLPIGVAGTDRPPLLVLAGVSPRLSLDEACRGFYELVAAALSAALATARAREAERRRADALAELDRAKTAFFANVSHEFRTPLTLMLGPIEESMAQRAVLPHDERERVALVHRNGRRLLRLVNTLLDFSRIEAGRADAWFEPTDLAALTAELASNFRSATERAGLTLVVDAPPLPAPVFLDRAMWEKIVLNLLSNAFKFTLRGGIRVEVRASADGGAAELRVRDTGTGIASHELPRLFERFHRVEGAQGRSFEGSGIGLALVRELVGLHGGAIGVESEPGRGSVFTVRVPTGSAHLPAEWIGAGGWAGAGDARTQGAVEACVEEALGWLQGAVPAAAGPAGDPGSAASRGRVLLADDNADMRGYVARLLGAAGFAVEAVADGQAAIAAARREAPDLVLSDVMMPRLDGFGLLAALRAEPALAEMPVVLLSARSGEEARIEGIEAGADDYLTKPFSARELVARVSTSLNLARERRDASRRASEVRLRLAVEAGRIGEWELDLATDTSVRAPRHDEIFGYGEPIPGWGFGVFIGHVVPADRPAVEAAFRRAAAGDGGWDFECRIRRANDGQVRWIAARSAPQRDSSGRAVRLVGLVQDITERKTTEEQLRALNADLERKVTERSLARGRTWQLSPDIIGVLNAEGRFEQSNPAWGAILGWSEAELARTDIFDLVHPDDVAPTRRVFEDLFGHGRPAMHFENRHRHRDGGFRWLSWVAVPDDGKTYCSARDVTAQKAQAEELALAQDALRQSQKLDSMGQLTGGVAHDFNNLLTPIIGSLDLLQRRGVGSVREQRLIEGALQSAERAKLLVQRLLAFARRQPLQPTAVDLRALVDGMAGLIASTSGPRVRVVVDVEDALPLARADANQLEMAILNLSVNARDAMGQGGTLAISARAEAVGAGHRSRLAPATYIRLSIADTGSGMDEATLARAIEPFFSTKGVGQGTGLGLSMVHGLAAQLGGQLSISSAPGAGTTVELWLPTSEEAPRPAENATVPATPFAAGTVLLVDDEALVRMSTADMLAELGFAVAEAGSAEEALGLVRDGLRFDLLVTDHLMPGMSGTELARRVRGHRPGTPVVLVSGYAEVEGVEPDLPRLAKPFRRTELAACLAGVLDGRAGERVSGAPVAGVA